MLRTHTCGELRLSDVNKEVTLCGWVQRIRDKGSIIWIDLARSLWYYSIVFHELIALQKYLKRYILLDVNTLYRLKEW